MKKQTRLLLSLGILFHLAVVVSVPNASSILNAQLRQAFVPYANLIGFHSFWQFFSPDPGSPVYLRYRLFSSGQIIGQGDFPALKDSYFWRTRTNRRIAAVKFFVRPPENGIQKYFAPFLCRTHPEASSVEVSVIIMRVPSLEEVHRGTPLNTLEFEQAQGSETYLCDQGNTGDQGEKGGRT